jgi:hypothetical protein
VLHPLVEGKERWHQHHNHLKQEQQLKEAEEVDSTAIPP